MRRNQRLNKGGGGGGIQKVIEARLVAISIWNRKCHEWQAKEPAVQRL